MLRRARVCKRKRPRRSAYLSTDELAERLGISIAALEGRRRQGGWIVPFPQPMPWGGRAYFDRLKVVQWERDEQRARSRRAAAR